MRLCKALWVVLLTVMSVSAPALAQDGGAKPATGAGDATAGDAKAGDTKAGDSKAADTKAADTKAADTKAADKPTASGDDKATAGSDAKPADKPAPVASSGGMDGATYVVRLRDLEQRIDELKEQIRRSHTRLSLLSDTILSGGVGGARAEIKFTNDMSNAFRLIRALFVLDGAVQYNKQDDSGALAEQNEIPIFSGSIPPGDHTLQVLLQLRGHGYGVFSYLRGYKFEVKSSHSFTVTEGKTVALEAVAYEKGGVTTPLEQRPAVRYVEKLRSGSEASPASAPSGSGSNTSGSFSIGTGGK